MENNDSQSEKNAEIPPNNEYSIWSSCPLVSNYHKKIKHNIIQNPQKLITLTKNNDIGIDGLMNSYGII
jgi:hypothetical protein